METKQINLENHVDLEIWTCSKCKVNKILNYYKDGSMIETIGVHPEIKRCKHKWQKHDTFCKCRFCETKRKITGI